MAEPKPTTNPLKKKLGPAPVWVWAVVGVVGYYLYRKYSGSGAASSALTTPTTAASPTSDTTGATGGGVSGGSSTPAGFSAADVAGIVQPFSDALNNTLGYNGQLEQSIIASYLPTGPGADSGGASSGAATWAQPEAGANYVPSPMGASLGLAAANNAAQHTTAKAPAAAPTKYYTYKAKVPLKKGQTLHFTKGKGYYAA